jgi:8-oxo-dGTP pyrophosphatase MutT (NUDIX family)
MSNTIKSKFRGADGIDYLVEYSDADTFDHLDYDRCTQCYGVCFIKNSKTTDTLVIGFGGKKKGWGLIGGSIEKGETYEQTLRREIIEESNMEILSFLPVGYQKMTVELTGNFFFQLRYVCIVRPLGEFKIDAGEGMAEKGITAIKQIDPLKYREYFNWGEIGERIIQRAIELKSKFL